MIPFSDWYLYLIPALPLLGFLVNGGIALGKREWGKLPGIIGSLLPLGSFVIAVWCFLVLAIGPEGTKLAPPPLFTWLSTSIFNIDFGFLLDPLSAVMVLVVTGVGTLIHFYSIGYMRGDPGFARYFAYLNLFLFFMLLLVLGENLIVLFVGWEGVGLCSYLLIGFWFTDPEKASAGKKAFVVNRIGDFGFLIGLFLIVYAFTSQSQSSDLSFFSYSFMEGHKEIFLPFATAITLCLFAGATGKSAQIPLYVWLPDAMAGPTPVSALIHAATMVTAGVYMVARLFFLFSMAPITLEVITVIGLATAMLAALIALTQNDIKKVLAYSTVSQLGFMFLGLGVGAPQSAVFHLMTHAFFKACLFLCAGSIIYALHHEQDIRKMGGLFKKMPVTAVAFLISTLAIAGIPPFSGFFSKDEILWNAFLHAGKPVYWLALATAGLTAFYMFRLFSLVFLGDNQRQRRVEGEAQRALPAEGATLAPLIAPKGVSKIPAVMNVPVALLAVLAFFGGELGIPEVLGGHNYFHHFLSYLSAAVPHEGLEKMELTMMAVSAGWAAFFSLAALYLYRNRDWARGLKARLSAVYKFSLNKFYVDEVYDFLIVKPLYHFSRGILWKGSDGKLIDGALLGGLSGMTTLGAKIVSRFQTGVLGNYLFYLWVGLAGLLWITIVK
ncbi:MAG: NADH-quinone oxidoreductase subunit L [Deltaproteobacteria bacterium]|nr:NADH-quinone oxidoreductase subunit L [Deltaproteobacteria bacterium]